MLRFIRRFSVQATAIVLSFALWRCGTPAKKQEYAHHANGYYYKLLAFNTDALNYDSRNRMQLSAGFYTQADSLFWDSDNNLSDNFFVSVDSSASNNFLKQYSSRCSVGDSVCLLIKTSDFFMQQFKTSQIPFFSKNDSVVKVRFKVKQQLSAQAFAAIQNNGQKKEQEQIRNFYSSEAAFEKAKDPLGFYWVEKGAATSTIEPAPGNVLTLHYQGSYLSGRFLEASPSKFELVYGAPDQLLKGLNYVIGRIKIGQNVKIILPSRLAFGENGSTSGIIPPYTPLLYEIKITDIKQ